MRGGQKPESADNMKNAMIKDFLQAFGPGAHLFADALWVREANGCAFAHIRVDVSVIDGRGRVVARAVDAHTESCLFVSYDEEDAWWRGEGGRAADARCAELDQEDWGDTPVSWFEATDCGLLPWEEGISDEYVGGIESLNKGRSW